MPIGLDFRFDADIGDRTGSIRIEGRQSQLDAFQPPGNLFTVDCSDLTEPGTYILPVEVNLPRGVSLIRREPEEIDITLTLKETDLPE
jgi:YbbR domain-containing protein